MNCRRWRADQGFTLLEVMVVMLIVGIMATMVTLSMGNRSIDDRLQTEAERMEQLILLAQDESALKGIPLGLRFTASGYQFLALDEKSHWVDYSQGALGDRVISQPFYVELHIEGRQVPPAEDAKAGDSDAQSKVLPQILLLPGGECTAFAIDVLAPGDRAYYHIEADALGKLQRERRVAA